MELFINNDWHYKKVLNSFFVFIDIYVDTLNMTTLKFSTKFISNL